GDSLYSVSPERFAVSSFTCVKGVPRIPASPPSRDRRKLGRRGGMAVPNAQVKEEAAQRPGDMEHGVPPFPRARGSGRHSASYIRHPRPGSARALLATDRLTFSLPLTWRR